jgi:hypothetical protein
MPKGILKFDLSDAFEEELFKLAVKSKDFYFAVQEFDQYLRTEAKYMNDKKAREMRELLYAYLGDHGVNLDMLS